MSGVLPVVNLEAFVAQERAKAMREAIRFYTPESLAMFADQVSRMTPVELAKELSGETLFGIPVVSDERPQKRQPKWIGQALRDIRLDARKR